MFLAHPIVRPELNYFGSQNLHTSSFHIHMTSWTQESVWHTHTHAPRAAVSVQWKYNRVWDPAVLVRLAATINWVI